MKLTNVIGFILLVAFASAVTVAAQQTTPSASKEQEQKTTQEREQIRTPGAEPTGVPS